VRVALYGLKLKPDWVLSGVNHGGNLGQDAVISGTVAAAREAAYHGLPSAAFSHYIISGMSFDWQRVSCWCAEMLQAMLGQNSEAVQAMRQPLGRGCFWNVNFPHLPAGSAPLPQVVSCLPARSPLNVSFAEHEGGYLYDASYAARPQDAGSDVEACFGGAVAVTQLSI
jgi:5'-nucleotidase